MALADRGASQLIRNVKLLPEAARSIPRKRCPSAVTAYWATLGFVASFVENRRDRALTESRARIQPYAHNRTVRGEVEQLPAIATPLWLHTAVTPYLSLRGEL